jgi:hypothetical protein
MTEHVIEVDGVEVIEAPSQRSGASASKHGERVDRCARPVKQMLQLSLRLLVALLSVAIVGALSIGHVLGAVLRRAQEALADRAPCQTADRARRT